MTVKVQCALCEEGHTLKQLRKLALDTMVCAKCYRKMQEAPVEWSCFGKISVYQQVGDRLVQLVRAYHPKAIECSSFCPDRRVCKAVLKGEEL